MTGISRRSLASVNALVALWIVLTCNLSFFKRLHALTPFDDWRLIVFLLSAIVLLWAYINFVLQWLTWGRLARPMLTFILVASALTAFFVDSFGVGIDGSQIQNMMETDVREVSDLLSWRMLAYVLVLAGLPLWWLWRRPLQADAFWPRQRHRMLASVVSLLLVGGIASVFYADYASIFRNHREIRLVINPQNYIAGLRSYYRLHTAGKDLSLVAYGTDAHRRQAVGSTQKPLLLVLVVGETARAESFGLNGYARDTTPELAKRQVLNFSQVSSCGTATAVSLPCMFSGFTRADYDAGLARHREGLLDIIQRAGYQVTWMDNNSGCKHTCDRVHLEPMLAERQDIWCRDGECQDDLLIDTFAEFLKRQPARDQVIVLHQQGSHGPAYFKRYPDNFRRFQPSCDSNELQSCSREAVVNAYDNTIAYTDHILARAIDILQQQDSQYRSVLWYVSDHGESTGEHGLYLHGAPYLFAPSQQTHVPMVAWLSPALRQGMQPECMRRHLDDELSHDHLFHTLLGLLQVRTAVYRPELDISAGCT